jgi:hypothetical protein
MNIISALVTEFCIRLKRLTNLHLFASALVVPRTRPDEARDENGSVIKK